MLNITYRFHLHKIIKNVSLFAIVSSVSLIQTKQKQIIEILVEIRKDLLSRFTDSSGNYFFTIYQFPWENNVIIQQLKSTKCDYKRIRLILCEKCCMMKNRHFQPLFTEIFSVSPNSGHFD